ncbi:unnamed protein product [Musa acuminata var. zebrina]
MISRYAQRAPIPFDQPKLQNTIPQIKNSRRNPQKCLFFLPPKQFLLYQSSKSTLKTTNQIQIRERSNRHGGRETKDPICCRYLLRQTTIADLCVPVRSSDLLVGVLATLVFLQRWEQKGELFRRCHHKNSSLPFEALAAEPSTTEEKFYAIIWV